jgi:hypothetical protein
MRKWLRPHQVASVGLASLLAVLVTAAPATARIFSLAGSSTATRGCNADTRVRFDVVILAGHYRKVKDFEVKDEGFPNATPPVPYGHPSGDCIAGEPYWFRICPNSQMGPCAAPFGEGELRTNEFFGLQRYPTTGPAVNYEAYAGAVNTKKVGRRHHRHFRVTAHGDFVIALSEGGLRYHGSSTGQVEWRAHS